MYHMDDDLIGRKKKIAKTLSHNMLPFYRDTVQMIPKYVEPLDLKRLS